MYLGVDVGGTKTLVVTLDDSGVILERQKFPTAKQYTTFLGDLAKSVANFSTKEFIAAGIGLPGAIDRKQGKGIAMGNLPWENMPIRSDLSKIINCSKIVVENDAKLAALSEALLLKKQYSNILYITLGTGIGIAQVVDGGINLSLNDLGGKTLELERYGKVQAWEDFASGRALTRRFGKRAGDITDPEIWQTYAGDLAVGLIELIALLQPEVVVIGGGVGSYFDRFSKPLQAALTNYATPLLPIPPIRVAARPEDAVIYGCYDLAKATYGKHSG